MRLALSHSRLNDFQQCPRKFYLKYIEKAKNFQIDDSNKSIHLVRGNNVHKALENYVIARKNGIPPEELISKNLPEVESTKPLIEKYISVFGIDNVHPEKKVCISDEWRSLEWFSKQAFYRGIFDLICLSPNTALVGDYKTGKFTDYTPPSGFGQLELSAAIALSIYDVEEVAVTYLYVDHKQQINKTYSQKDRIKLVEHFQDQHEKVNEEKAFDPTKNKFCRWCDATKEQCKFAPN